MPLVVVAIGVLLLIILIMGFKLNTFVSLIIVSCIAALFLGIPLESIVTSIETGMGSTLGHIALVFGLGAMLGRLIADAGGASRIAVTLIKKFGEKKVQWAVVLASFIVGMALFLEIGFILLIPIVYTIAKELKVSLVSLVLPMSAALVTTHSFLPPHPGITTVAGEYGANVGSVLLYGIIVAIPSVYAAGILYPKFARKIVPNAFKRMPEIESLGEQKIFKLEETPGFVASVLTAMLPVIIMIVAAIVDIVQKSIGFDDNLFIVMIRTLGKSPVAMLISLLVALYTMGIARKIPIKKLMDSCGASINAIGMMLLIIGGGGAFKQVIIDGGVGDYVSELFANTSLSPVLFAWIVAAILRISLGSGTVAAISAVALVLPVISQTPDVNLALVTLATGAGSTIASHVNDAGFWMVKEYSGMTLKEAFATYTVICTIASVVGLICIMLLDMIV